MLIDHARRLWSRTGWARLGRIADALERIDGRKMEPPPIHPEPPGTGIKQRMGLTLLLDPASPVDRWMIETGTWEPEQLAKLKALAAEAMSRTGGPRVFLDIGAYFGLYALLMDRKRLFDRVIAFEPDRMNFAQLQTQLFLNDAAYRIEAMNVAAGAASGEAQMLRSDLHQTGNRGGVGVRDCSADPRCVPTKVMAVDELGLSGGLVVAKIDVESGQDVVLCGMRRTIAANVCVIQVEAFDEQRPTTVRLLSDLGLSVVAEIPPDLYAVRWTSI